MKNSRNIIPFEEYLNKILNKEPSKILLELFPNFSHPTKSRFQEFFKKLNELNKDKTRETKKNNIPKKNKKNTMEFNLYKIQNGTSLMIKNIPKCIDEINVVRWLLQLANLNYSICTER